MSSPFQSTINTDSLDRLERKDPFAEHHATARKANNQAPLAHFIMENKMATVRKFSFLRSSFF